MLDELFSWVSGVSDELLVSYQTVTQVSIETERKLAMLKQRELRADLYAARSTASVSDIPQRVTRHDEYLRFIALCSAALAKHEQLSNFALGLGYLLAAQTDGAEPASNEAKINRLFYAYLKANKEEALRFYHDHKRELVPFRQIQVMVDAEKTNDYLSQFTSLFSTQKNPLTIAPLFMRCIEDTEQFAALILWLFRRGVSIEAILQTNLLQSFMAYNAAWVSSSDSPVHHLYDLLAQFPEAKELIRVAGTVQCEERGLHCGETEGRSYAITGVLLEQSMLHRVEVKIPPVEFTPTAENFAAFYQVFGPGFLADALLWDIQCHEGVWHTALHDAINREAMIGEQLPALINYVAVNCEPEALAALAALVEPITLDKLVGSHSGAVLHLLPYQPTLLAKIDEAYIRHYLSQLKVVDDSAFDVIPQLLALLTAYRDSNHAVAELVYEATIDIALRCPQLFDDRGFIHHLRNFPGKEDTLTKLCARLQSQFDQCIAPPAAEPTLTTSRYHIIEDMWLSVSHQFALLNKIMRLVHHCPHDKYQLHAQLATLYLSTHAGYFNLDEFIAALEIAPELASDEVNVYERVLIELLATIDDERIRVEIIAKFEANEAKRSKWMHHDYGDECVFIRAARGGNVGLIHYLQSKMMIDDNDISRAVKVAAEAKQWCVVDHFCASSPCLVQRSVLKEILCLAAADGQVNTVQLLCEKAISHLKENHTARAFLQAAANGSKPVVAYFCHLHQGAPSPQVIAKALKTAVQFESLDIIDFIGNLPTSALLTATIERALIHAATRDNLTLVQHLCQIQMNAPRSVVIVDAFLRAVRFGHKAIAQYLSHVYAPDQRILHEALSEATTNRQLDMVKFLCGMTPGPSQAMIEQAFQESVKAKRPDFVQYFCDLASPPRQRVLKSAFYDACKLQDAETIALLSRFMSPRIIEQTIYLAAKQGQLAILQHCCEVTPPARNVIASAIRRASSNKHPEVASYLRSLLTLTNSPTLPMPRVSPGLSIKIPDSLDIHRRASISMHRSSSPYPAVEDEGGLKKSASCGALPILGFFGSRSRPTTPQAPYSAIIPLAAPVL